MKKYLKMVAYPLICFFSLILSLAVLAELIGKMNELFLAHDLIFKLRFLSLVVYVLLIVAGGYLLTKAHNLAAVSVAFLIFIFSLVYLILDKQDFVLLIYYFLYAVIVAGFGLSQLKQERIN